jgi:F0F1-type ATP synthase epsilon subunit
MTARIQKLIDIAFYCENRFEDHETVYVTVGGFAELARSYLAIREALENAVNDTKQRILDAEEAVENIQKLLNAKTEGPAA